MTFTMKVWMTEVMIVMASSLVCSNFHFVSKFTEKATLILLSEPYLPPTCTFCFVCQQTIWWVANWSLSFRKHMNIKAFARNHHSLQLTQVQEKCNYFLNIIYVYYEYIYIKYYMCKWRVTDPQSVYYKLFHKDFSSIFRLNII